MNPLLLLALLGQTPQATSHRPQATPAVTRLEAAAVFAKADKIVCDVLQIKAITPAFAAGKGPATRAMIVSHFMAIYRAAEPKFKFTPPPLRSAPQLISLNDAASKQAANKLEVLGFIDRYGSLATSKAEGLQPWEFGDALGYFLARVAELTHTPSAKFSPYLMPG